MTSMTMRRLRHAAGLATSALSIFAFANVATAQAEAARRGLPLNWHLHTIEGIGHDGAAMSAVCAHLWFHHRLPGAAQLAALAGRHTA